jgi:hypothetical protein
MKKEEKIGNIQNFVNRPELPVAEQPSVYLGVYIGNLEEVGARWRPCLP